MADQRWGLTLPLPGAAARRRMPSWCAAPRRPATPTSGAARPTAPTGSRRWRCRRPGPSGRASAPGSSASSSAARRCWRRRRRRWPTHPGAASCSGSAPPRTGSSKAGTGSPSSGPLSKVAETLEFLRAALDGERTSTGFKLETAPAERVPIVLAALRGKMLELAVERADGAFTNFLPLAGAAEGDRAARRRRRRVRAAVPLLLPAGRARAGRAAGPVHVLLLHHRAGLRGLLPLARLRARDRRDGRRLGGQGPPGRGGGGALGADRGHVRLRHPGGDEGSARRLRGRAASRCRS